MANAFFSDLLSTISERGRILLGRAAAADDRQDPSELLELCEALLSGRGEASGTAMAREVLDRYHHLDGAGSYRSSRPWRGISGLIWPGCRWRSRAGATIPMARTPAICISQRSRAGRN